MSATYRIQARLGDRFEDLYITAESVAEAIEIARERTELQHPYTNFVA